MKIFTILILIILGISCSERKYKEYYSTGEIKIIAIKDKHGEFHDEYFENYKNGNLKQETKYAHGKQKWFT